MSGFDVEPEDMTRAAVLDEKLNALLAGHKPASGDELGSELSLVLEQIQKAFPSVIVSEQVEDLHFTQMMDAAAGLSADVTAPTAAAQATDAVMTPSTPLRGGFLDKIRAGLSYRVAAATLALTTAFGGAAYAGVLPTPIQSAVANAAAAIGLQLPRPGDEDPAVVDEDERADQGSEEVIDGRLGDDRRRDDASTDGGDDERKGTAGDPNVDWGDDQTEVDRDDDPDGDETDSDGEGDAEADGAADDHSDVGDDDEDDRSDVSDDREDVNDSDRDDARETETDDDFNEQDDPESSSDDDAPSEADPESETGELDD